jgi:hypothetical protein
MVHALEKVHSLLMPGGRLIDIHPSGQPPPLHVRLGAEVLCAGWLRETDDYVEYEQADDALRAVVARGLFAWEARRTFTFTIYADNLAALHDFLAQEWQDAILDDQVSRRAADWLQVAAPDKALFVREIINIARLRPLWAREKFPLLGRVELLAVGASGFSPGVVE